jgi:serine/threonine-protein phosphatase 6 regulatory subunit 3
MGHITLLTEQILLSLEHFPEDLVREISDCVPQPAWDEYIHGPFCVAKAKDAAVIGGGKPTSTTTRLGGTRWTKVDEEDDVLSKGGIAMSRRSDPPPDTSKISLKGEFRRVPTLRQGFRRHNADFGPFTPTEDPSQRTHQVSRVAGRWLQ